MLSNYITISVPHPPLSPVQQHHEPETDDQDPQPSSPVQHLQALLYVQADVGQGNHSPQLAMQNDEEGGGRAAGEAVHQPHRDDGHLSGEA